MCGVNGNARAISSASMFSTNSMEWQNRNFSLRYAAVEQTGTGGAPRLRSVTHPYRCFAPPVTKVSILQIRSLGLGALLKSWELPTELRYLNPTYTGGECWFRSFSSRISGVLDLWRCRCGQTTPLQGTNQSSPGNETKRLGAREKTDGAPETGDAPTQGKVLLNPPTTSPRMHTFSPHEGRNNTAKRSHKDALRRPKEWRGWFKERDWDG